MKRSLFWLLDHYSETDETIAALHESALTQAAEADRLGFESLWLAEHHFLALGTAPNPAILLAAIAQRTQRIRLGPAVAVLPLRDPIHVAEDYALVDALSGGRLNMGVGTGSQPTEYEAFGVDYDGRREGYTAALTSIRSRWRAATRGERGVDSLNVAPVQSPTPPFYVATMNEEAAYNIGLAGDSMLTLVPPPASGLNEVAARVRAHTRGLADAKQTSGRAEAIVMMFAHAADTKEEARANVAPALASLLRAMRGIELPDAEGFYEQMRRSDVGLFGTPMEIAQQVRRLADLGVRHVAFISRFGGMSDEVAVQSLRRLAPDASGRRS